MPLMFGPRLSSLFTSRWMALLWAAFIILTALSFVGSGDDSQPVDSRDAATLAHAFGDK